MCAYETTSVHTCQFIDPSIWTALQKRLRQPTTPNITDVYDGQQYKQHSHFLSNPSHVSLMINTDGVAIFRSSKSSVWPIWIAINELPKEKRYVYGYIVMRNPVHGTYPALEGGI